MTFKTLKTHKMFDGEVRFLEHDSKATGTAMKLSAFVPAGEVRGCLIWLSGLTCNEENFITKAGAQRYLAEAKLAVICPDTSPRGLTLPGEHDSWDFGSGAGFYVDATTPGYRDHYRMETYIADELYDLIPRHVPGGHHIGILGHSMGGHGALVLGLRRPSQFTAISAFSPIVNPSRCPWGRKAFTGYLGPETGDVWARYDAVELVKSGAKHRRPILVDQGTDDSFLERELKPHLLASACELTGQPLEMRMRQGYDHSYYFIATFIEEHVRFHARWMND